MRRPGAGEPTHALRAVVAALTLLLVALVTLVAPLAAAAPLPEEPRVTVDWQTPADAGGARRFLPSTHEFPIVVRSDAGAPLSNVTLIIEAPAQPFRLTLEGPDPEDTRPNPRKPYAFWPLLPRASPPAPCACGFAIVHSAHSDDFSGGFEFAARLTFELPNGTRAYAESMLLGSIEGGAVRFQPWQVWLVSITVLAVVAGGLWMARRRPQA